MEPLQLNPGLPILTKIFEGLGGIEGIISLFTNCANSDDTDAQVMTKVNQPGNWAVARMGRRYKREGGFTRRQWRDIRASIHTGIRQECATLTLPQCQPFIEEWRDEVIDE